MATGYVNRCVIRFQFHMLLKSDDMICRAWSTVGFALRFSIAMGMHVRCRTLAVGPGRSDTLSRIWWSLRSLDIFLSSITQRPCTVSDQDCSVPLPRSPTGYQEVQETVVLMQANFKISVITQCALSSLYSVRAAKAPLQHAYDYTLKLMSELKKLLPTIPDRESLTLHFNWFDVVTRPYLYAFANCNDTDEALSAAYQKIAKECVSAAPGLTRLLPDEQNESVLRNGPWWCLVQYIMESIAVVRKPQYKWTYYPDAPQDPIGTSNQHKYLLAA
jgi:hypothetical protein